MHSIKEIQEEIYVGIDTGGTFTDCILSQKGKPPIAIKVHSTPENPAEAIINGLERLCKLAEIPIQSIKSIFHGTTVATNAMLQEQWAKVGLITTKGFRDVLEIGTQMRPELYKLQQQKPAPIVPRNLRMEVTERIAPSGEIIEGISKEKVYAVLKNLITEDIESLAVVFLFSYANAEHETLIREVAEELAPDLYVGISSEISPEFREYTRTSTTVINAALTPIVRRYIRHLRRELEIRGVSGKLSIMQSNGGIASGEAEVSAHNLVLSGPAGGIVAASDIAKNIGFSNVLTFDMGGTSSDIGIIIEGKPQVSEKMTVNNSYPLQTPAVDIHTVGAGGGSIGWKDSGGALKVGPKSAGASPGPACYGKGGLEPTVTDANLYLGRLDANNFLGGEFKVHLEKSHDALKALADNLELDVERVALGILEVANANMAGALRVVSSQRGHDPRDFALIAFGGAGPLHATALARELGVKHVIIPATPGVLCAHGLLLSDVRHDFMHTEIVALESSNPALLESRIAELEERGSNRLYEDDVPSHKIRLNRTLDLRYKGQEYYLNVPFVGDITKDVLEKAAQDFHEIHHKTYGHAAMNEPVEIVNLRVTAIGEMERLDSDSPSTVEALSQVPSAIDYRSVYFQGAGWINTPIFQRESLKVNVAIEGPAIVMQMDTTIVVEPGQFMKSDEQGNLIISMGGKQ